MERRARRGCARRRSGTFFRRRADVAARSGGARRAAGAGLYTNLITQGTFLDDTLLDSLLEAGSITSRSAFRPPKAGAADRIAGAVVHERKLDALARVRERDVALTLNCVLHRRNHDALGDVIAFAERHGIGGSNSRTCSSTVGHIRNRAALMPTLEQVREAERLVAAARERLRGTMEIVYVLPDYFGEYPKPCMNGWGGSSSP